MRAADSVLLSVFHSLRGDPDVVDDDVAPLLVHEDADVVGERLEIARHVVGGGVEGRAVDTWAHVRKNVFQPNPEQKNLGTTQGPR